MFLDEPSGKAERVLAAGVLQRTLALGCDTDDGSLADGKNLTVHLILALALQDDVKFLVSLMGVKETAVLTCDQRPKLHKNLQFSNTKQQKSHKK